MPAARNRRLPSLDLDEGPAEFCMVEAVAIDHAPKELCDRPRAKNARRADASGAGKDVRLGQRALDDGPRDGDVEAGLAGAEPIEDIFDFSLHDRPRGSVDYDDLVHEARESLAEIPPSELIPLGAGDDARGRRELIGNSGANPAVNVAMARTLTSTDSAANRVALAQVLAAQRTPVKTPLVSMPLATALARERPNRSSLP
jgi:hypothetical protein